MKTIFFLLTLILNSPVYAQNFKVLQVKGTKAIVEIQNGETLNTGQTYNINSVHESFSPSVISKNQRQYLLGLNLSLTNSKSDTANASTQTGLDINARFGWNSGFFEFGPLGTFGYLDNGTNKTTTFTGGAFGTYNFTENKPGQIFIYAVEGAFSYGMKKTQTSTTSYDDTLLTATFGPYAKWFGLSNDFNINGGLIYSYTKYTPGLQNSPSYSTSGFALAGGIATYF